MKMTNLAILSMVAAMLEAIKMEMDIDDIPNQFRDAPDSWITSCTASCSRKEEVADICRLENVGRNRGKCRVACDASWQDDWSKLHPVAQKCLEIYYTRWLYAYNSFNDNDCGIDLSSFWKAMDNRNRQFKINKGGTTPKFRFPWAMLVTMKQYVRPRHNLKIGTAVYIGNGYALTSASVVRTVGLAHHSGKDFIFSTDEDEVIIDVDNDVILHPSVDLALVKMRDQIEFLSPICLPRKDLCATSGCTSLRLFGYGPPDYALRSANLYVSSKCAAKYVCLDPSATGQNACDKSDRGGGMEVPEWPDANDAERIQLFGITVRTSKKVECGSEPVVTIGVDIRQQIDWICQHAPNTIRCKS